MVDLSDFAENAELESIQSFDPSSVARTADLGTRADFTAAVPVVSRVVKFFRQIPADQVHELPEPQRSQVDARSKNIWNTIQKMLAFDPNQTNAAVERQGLINLLDQQYGEAFGSLGTVLAFFHAQPERKSRSEEEMAFLLESAHAAQDELLSIRLNAEKEAERMLAEVRKVSAEAGVSQQAIYFGNQAENDGTTAGRWETRTNLLALLLISFAILTWVLSYSWTPTNIYQTTQLVVSKVLIVSTIAYLLFLSGRTLMAHRHNEIVNRHRQNALLTFNALADAAPSDQTREVVLTHASACIYAPQETGFTKAGNQSPSSLIELAPRILGASHSAGGAA